jgi:hypothetical protein
MILINLSNVLFLRCLLLWKPLYVINLELDDNFSWCSLFGIYQSMGPLISDHNKWLIALTGNTLSGFHWHSTITFLNCKHKSTTYSFECINMSILQCPPLKRIFLGKYKCDNNNRMIQWTDVFCVLFISYRASNFWLQ